MSTVARRITPVGMATKPTPHHHDVPLRTTSTWPSPAHPYVTDGGLETDLIFNRGVQLHEFAAYPLLRTERGRAMLDAYYDGYAEIARRHGKGLLLETPTWRASAHWGELLGDDRRALYDINVQAVRHLLRLRERYADLPAVLISGAIGPSHDAYAAIPDIDPDIARIYHEPQIGALAEGGADLITAFTLSDPGEAIGIAHAAFFHGLPVVIGFTVETDGRLRGGMTLREAIETVDAETDTVQYMINCAHPEHVLRALDEGDWRERVLSVRYNASTRSHAELDEATTIDSGDVHELRRGHDEVRAMLPGLGVVGGCCGTDTRHIAALWEERTPV